MTRKPEFQLRLAQAWKMTERERRELPADLISPSPGRSFPDQASCMAKQS
jgi:hypothetical protein